MSYLFYIGKSNIATLKNTKTEKVSTIVVISGDAIIAGSNLSFCATIGSIQPINSDKITISISVKPIVNDKSTVEKVN